MAATLSLQDLELPTQTRSDLQHSANSVYACTLASLLSMVCPG